MNSFSRTVRTFSVIAGTVVGLAALVAFPATSEAGGKGGHKGGGHMSGGGGKGHSSSGGEGHHHGNSGGGHNHGGGGNGIKNIQILKGTNYGGRVSDWLMVDHPGTPPIVVSVGETYDKTYEGKQQATQLLQGKGLNQTEINDFFTRRQQIIDRLNQKLNATKPAQGGADRQESLNDAVKNAFQRIENHNDQLRDAGVQLGPRGDQTDHNVRTQQAIQGAR